MAWGFLNSIGRAFAGGANNPPRPRRPVDMLDRGEQPIPYSDATPADSLDLPSAPVELPMRPNINRDRRRIDPATGVFVAPPSFETSGPELTGGNAAGPRNDYSARIEDVPLPPLPGRTSTRAYSPENLALDAYVSSRPNSTNVKGFGARMKSGFKPALLGMLQAMGTAPAGSSLSEVMGRGIGGAGAGLAGGALDPTGGREFEFDTLERPRMERDRQQRQQEEDRQAAIQKRRIEAEQEAANIDFTKARTEAARTGIEESKANAEAQRELRRAQAAKYEAEAEARRTGQPRLTDYVNEEGAVMTGWVFPDGRIVEAGGSAKTYNYEQMNKNRRETEEMKEKGRNTRAGQSESGRNSRASQAEAGRNLRLDTQEAGRDRRLQGTTGKPAAGAPARKTINVNKASQRYGDVDLNP